MTSARNIARRSFRSRRSRSSAPATAIERANATNDGRVVTTIEPACDWYPAEDYHQDYWSGEGQRNPYCLAIIPPKLNKLRKSFQDRVKSARAHRLACGAAAA